MVQLNLGSFFMLAKKQKKSVSSLTQWEHHIKKYCMSWQYRGQWSHSLSKTDFIIRNYLSFSVLLCQSQRYGYRYPWGGGRLPRWKVVSRSQVFIPTETKVQRRVNLASLCLIDGTRVGNSYLFFQVLLAGAGSRIRWANVI